MPIKNIFGYNPTFQENIMGKITLDYNNAIAVLRDIFWIGFYDQESSLHCNPYLLIDDEDVVLIDPGSIPHFPIVMRKIIDTINPAEITAIVASHQDPDVCGGLAVVEDVIGRKDLKIIAHSNTIRLIRHYGLSSDYYAVDKNDYKYLLKSGRVLEFLYTPYLHSPGAIVTYDHKTHSLFTSDIFGAVSQNWSLYAEDNFLDAMSAFHQLYMPGNDVLRKCMEKFEKLNIARILPQHGSILEGENIRLAIDHLKALPCGNDLL